MTLRGTLHFPLQDSSPIMMSTKPLSGDAFTQIQNRQHVNSDPESDLDTEPQLQPPLQGFNTDQTQAQQAQQQAARARIEQMMRDNPISFLAEITANASTAQAAAAAQTTPSSTPVSPPPQLQHSHKSSSSDYSRDSYPLRRPRKPTRIPGRMVEIAQSSHPLCLSSSPR